MLEAIVDRRVFADVVLEEDRRHRRDVLVAEAKVDAGETGVAGLDCGDTDLRLCRASLVLTGEARPACLYC